MLKAALSEKKFRSRMLATAAAILPVVSAGLLAAPSAQADQIWYQSVGRTTANSSCQESTAADLAAGWTQWSSSWERWINAGAGGYTCSRSIVWAKDSASSQVGPAGCTPLYDSLTGLSVDFATSNYLPYGSTVYNEATCATVTSSINRGIAYGATQAEAQALCRLNEGLDAAYQQTMNPNIYACVQ